MLSKYSKNLSLFLIVIRSLAVVSATLLIATISLILYQGKANALYSYDSEWVSVSRVSLDNNGNQLGSASYGPKISGNGQFVVFESEGQFTNINNAGVRQIYLRNLTTNTTKLVSKNNLNQPANAFSGQSNISDDGRFVLYFSEATNITTESSRGLFLYDTLTDSTSLLSAGSVGGIPEMSSDNRYVTFSSSEQLVTGIPGGSFRVYVLDRQTNSLTHVSTGVQPTISDDGNFIAYVTIGFNPVHNDVYLYSRISGQKTLVSANSTGDRANDRSEGPSISADGRYVAFWSFATNLGSSSQSGVFLRDTVNQTTQEIVAGNMYGPYKTSISADGNYVASTEIHPNDSAETGIFVYNRSTNSLSIANTNVNGDISPNSNYPSMSNDGSQIVYQTKYLDLPNSNDVNGSIEDILLSTRASDNEPPVITNANWSSNPLAFGQDTTLSVTATDNDSGVVTVQYSINGGLLQNMVYNSSTDEWQSTFGGSLAINTYNIEVYATDVAGNVSQPLMDVLAVYDASNGYVTGHSKLYPDSNDILPIALGIPSNPNQPPKNINIGFTNIKAATSTTPTMGSFDINYVVKNNQDEFNISSKSISWLVVPDANSFSMLGIADMEIHDNGVNSLIQDVSIRFDVTLGASGNLDHIAISIYDTGVSPNTGSPTWVIDQDAYLSNILIL